MRSKSFKEYLEIVALIAVVVSLLLVAYQIQQANRIAVATVEIEISNNVSALNEFLMSHPEIDATISRIGGGGEVTDEDRQLLINMSRRLLNLWRGLETAYKSGLLPESTYRVAFDDMKLSIELASVERRRVWREVLDDYPSLAETEVFQAAYASLARAEKGSEN